MILEELIDVAKYFPNPIPGGILIVMFIVPFLFGMAFWAQRKIWKKLIGVLLMLLGVAFGVETIASLAHKEKPGLVYDLETYPVEYREENNTLYVFFDGKLQKVSEFTDEYIGAEDSMYVYHTIDMGDCYNWGRDRAISFKTLSNLVFLDSVKMPIAEPDTVLLEIGADGDFFLPLEKDSLEIGN